MNEFETGLRHRLRRALRQTAQQHDRLRVLHRRLEEVIERGAIEAVRPAAERLYSALVAHFELEDAVIFPAFHGLAQRSARELNTLASEHRRYLVEFEHLLAQLDAAALAKFADGYRSFFVALSEHEQREVALLSSLEDAADSPARSGERPASEARRSR
jgi:hypothetical protein